MVRGHHGWLLAALAILCGLSRDGMADEQVAPKEPEWLVLKIDAVRVAAQRPASAGTWDGEKEARDSGAGCKLLAVAVGVATSGAAGTVTGVLCRLAAGDGQQVQQDPKAPDLLIKVAADTQTIYRTYIAQDTYSHVFLYSLVVPVASIPRGGLQVMVVDQDGNDIGEGELIGSVRISRTQLVTTALGESPVMMLSDGPLEKLELTVEPYASGTRQAGHTHVVSQPLKALPTLTVHAGEVVELRAASTYRVANNRKHLLGPAGYQGGSRRSYNLAEPGFAQIAHGAAVASIGDRGARAGFAVDGCVSLTSPFTGELRVGVNDRDLDNNEGELRFDAIVRPARPEEWSRAGLLVRCTEAQPGASQQQRSPAQAATKPSVSPQGALQPAAMGWDQAQPAIQACGATHGFRGTAQLVIDISASGQGTMTSLVADGAKLDFVICVGEIVRHVSFEPAHGSRITASIQFK